MAKYLKEIGAALLRGEEQSPWVDIRDDTAVASAQRSLEDLAVRLNTVGLGVEEKRLNLFEAACETGTCFYDAFGFQLNDQSRLYVAFDGREIVHLKPLKLVEFDGEEKLYSAELREEVDETVLGMFKNLLSVLKIEHPPAGELAFLRHPLDIAHQHYSKMCIFPDGDDLFSRAIRSTLYKLGFYDVQDGNKTLHLFGHDSVRLYCEGDYRHINHLVECVQPRINAGQTLAEMAEHFTSPLHGSSFQRDHLFYVR